VALQQLYAGGAASGAFGAYLNDKNVGKGALYGAAAGTVEFATGYWLGVATRGDYHIAIQFIAGSAGGATETALHGGNAREIILASMQNGSIGAIVACVQTKSGLAPEKSSELVRENVLVAQACVSVSDCRIDGQIIGFDNKTGEYLLDIQLKEGQAGISPVELQGRRVLGHSGSYEGRLDSTSLGAVEIPLRNGPVRVNPPINPYGSNPNVQQGGGNYIDLRHGADNELNFRIPGWNYR